MHWFPSLIAVYSFCVKSVSMELIGFLAVTSLGNYFFGIHYSMVHENAE